MRCRNWWLARDRQGDLRSVCRSGPKVIIADVKIWEAEAVPTSLKERGVAGLPFPSMADLPACEALALRITKEIGAVSILVNNAGVGGGDALDADNARKVWDSIISVNLTGCST